MSLSNSISLIADKYYTIDEETGQLIDIKSLIGSSQTIINQEILDRKANIIDVNNTLNSKLNISTYEYFKNDLLPVTLNTKLNIIDFDQTNLSNLRITDFNNTNLANLKISDFNQTNLANLKISDFNQTNLANLKISDFNQTNLANLKISDFNQTNLANLKIDDFNNTVGSILFTANSKVSITEFSHFQITVNTKLNEKVNVLDYNNTHTSIINNINSRALTADYDTYKAATAVTLGEKLIYWIIMPIIFY